MVERMCLVRYRGSNVRCAAHIRSLLLLQLSRYSQFYILRELQLLIYIDHCYSEPFPHLEAVGIILAHQGQGLPSTEMLFKMKLLVTASRAPFFYYIAYAVPSRFISHCFQPFHLFRTVRALFPAWVTLGRLLYMGENIIHISIFNLNQVIQVWVWDVRRDS